MLLDLDLDGQEGHALHLAHVASRSWYIFSGCRRLCSSWRTSLTIRLWLERLSLTRKNKRW